MRLFKFLFATFILFATFNNTNGQVSSENLVGIHNLNTTQISGLVSPIKGSLVFNTDSNRLFVFDGAIWVATATVDTTSLSNRINQRVKYSDTSAMLAPYLKSAITSLQGLTSSVQAFAVGTTGTDFNILSSGSTHTYNMPSASATNRGALLSADWNNFNSKVSTVTATTPAAVSTIITPAVGIVPSTKVSTVNNTDAYWNANQIQGRGVSNSAPLNGQLLVYNSASNTWMPSNAGVDSTTASNGITLIGKDVRLGGNLTGATTITNNSNALTFATGGTAINITGLTAGTATDSLLTINATTGRVNRIAPNLLNKADSTTASNGISLSGKDVRLGGLLTTATTITTGSGNTLSLAGLQSGSVNDSVVVSDGSTGLLKRISANRLSTGWSLTGNAGTTAGTNFIGTTDGIDLVFKVNSVESGRLNLYNLSTSYGYNSIASYKSTAIGYAASTGTNTESVTIGNASSSVYRSVSVGSEAVSTGNNSIALGQSATAAFQGTALGSTASATGNNSTAIGFGATTSQANALILGNSSAQVGIGTSTPGYALDVNATSNPLKLSGLVSGSLNDSLMTINASTGVVRRIAPTQLNRADSTTASNGITLTGKDVRLGGTLTASTTITTDATNTLLLAGLQSSSLNDSVVMITSGNVLRRINSTSLALEPFNVLGGATKASSNTQNIYTQGDLSVGKSSNAATLDVGGKIKADSSISAPNFVSNYLDLGSVSGTINWNMQANGNVGVRLTANGTLSITNVTAGMYGLIRVTQDGTGGRTLTLPAGSRVINGGSSAVILTQTANAVDILTFFYDGTNYWWTIGNNYN